VRVPGGPEEVDSAGDELWWDADAHSAEVKNEAKDPVNRCDKELVQLVPGDRVLAEHSIQVADQDEDCLDAGINGLLELADIGDIKINVVVDVDTMRCWCGVAVGVKDALVEGIAEGPRKPGPFLTANGAASLDRVQDGAMLCNQRGIKEEAIGESREWIGHNGRLPSWRLKLAPNARPTWKVVALVLWLCRLCRERG
jgi:hypothetical protein